MCQSIIIFKLDFSHFIEIEHIDRLDILAIEFLHAFSQVFGINQTFGRSDSQTLFAVRIGDLLKHSFIKSRKRRNQLISDRSFKSQLQPGDQSSCQLKRDR